MTGQVMCCSCMMWELADPIASCNDHICSKCWLLEELRLKINELESEIQTLRHIRVGELSGHFISGGGHTRSIKYLKFGQWSGTAGCDCK